MITRLPDSNEEFTISDENLNRALEQVSLGFWEVNLVSGNFMSCTAQCKRNFGWETDKPFSYGDMLGRIIPEDLPEMQNQVLRSINDKTDYFAEYRVRHPDNSIRWIRAEGKVDYHQGVPQRISGTTSDITKIKNIELLRDELINVAMHELKTPLSTVKMALQLLQRGIQDETGKSGELVNRALRANDRMKMLLDDISRPVNAQLMEMQIDRTLFDLVELSEEIARNAEMVNPGNLITLSSVNSKMVVLADRNKMGQVISNLVNNAVKYAGSGMEIAIHISQEQEGTVLRVRDSGPGIPVEDRGRIFEKYYRSTSTISKEGLGLGLFICSEIVSKHGGTISVEDTDLPGTTIKFYIPSHTDTTADFG